MSILEPSGSQTIRFSTRLFMKKCLDSPPNEPFTPRLWDQSCVTQATNKEDSFFEQIALEQFSRTN